MTTPDRRSAEIVAEAKDLVVGYDRAVVGPINVRLGPGITALLGRNGAGKTTLMRTLCGVIPAVSGRCSVFGRDVSDGAAVRSQVGYLGHELALASALTVKQNLAFWREVWESIPQATLIDHDDLIGRFDLTALLGQRVRSLSRGQRQRVEMARLAMTDPDFVVLDEPLTGLDPVYAAQTRELLREWGETRTVLYSTHSVPEALELADRFLLVQGTDLIDLSHDDSEVTEQIILNHLEPAA
ncbi:hypothetical protein GCM10009784_14950 [Arthrobacter parietis]|uniref:ABC transporter ATP-binding protein n=2 Tax=Arthrobacter TaxID=1663 RepID=A0ABT6CZZ2_9MICC|nr:ABC transporter ATP-binding protein [Arthrobacter vasquezii]MDF9279346.1 ABC transporter ATP-binding protein [Arthrobacter vasquezii]